MEKLGFGCMRLPLKENGEIDKDTFCRMIDCFLAGGFNYFDTARPYHDGKSETAIRECLVNRYPRDRFILTDKLSTKCFKKEGGIRPFFESQLKACGVSYFNYYLMHAQASSIYEKFKRCHAYEIAREFQEEGKIRHIGISFHDTPDLLERILNENPFIEAVQLQFNYYDYENSAVQSKACYDVCVKHGKTVFVMEPIRGGKLVNLPQEALEKCKSVNISPAELALRFAAGFDNVSVVLSGMSTYNQVLENTSFMKQFTPLTDNQKETAFEIAGILKSRNLIDCTSCRYCTAGCPVGINIPDLFSCYNSKKTFKDWNSDWYYSFVYTGNNNKASDCMKCGQCERICPQHLDIRNYLELVVGEFETGEKVK